VSECLVECHTPLVTGRIVVVDIPHPVAPPVDEELVAGQAPTRQ